MQRGNLVESLENRCLLSGATTTFAYGVLEIRGTADANAVTAAFDANAGGVLVTETDYSLSTPLTRTIGLVSLAQLQRIVVFASDGDDQIRILVDVPATVHGAGGNDTIQTAGGNDVIFGGLGNDVVDAGAGNDSIYGKDGSDLIRGGDGNDLVYGQGKNDTIYGNGGNDTLYGDAGSDQLYGGLGDDRINIGALLMLTTGPGSQGFAPALLTPTVFHDYIRGGQGDDYILASSSDTVLGGAGRDVFRPLTAEPPTLPDFDSTEDILWPGDDPTAIVPIIVSID